MLKIQLVNFTVKQHYYITISMLIALQSQYYKNLQNYLKLAAYKTLSEPVATLMADAKLL